MSFSQQLRPVLVRPMAGCGCHLPTTGGAGPATQITGLDLSSLASLRAGGHNSGARIVVPLQPCDSVLYQKVSDAPPFGSRMPLNGPRTSWRWSTTGSPKAPWTTETAAPEGSRQITGNAGAAATVPSATKGAN